MKRTAVFQIRDVGVGAIGRYRRAAEEKDVTEIDDNYLYVSIVGLHGDQTDEEGNPKGNDNGDYFTWEDLLSVKANGPSRGKLTFQTWDGKPVHLNHDEAYSWGYIVSTFPISEEKAIYMLLALDKRKEPELCKAIQEGLVTAVSMGCTIQWSICGVCQHRSENDEDWCEHLKNYKGKRLPSTGKWVYEICKDVEGAEMSFIVKKMGSKWQNDLQADKGAEAKHIVANKKAEEDMQNISRDVTKMDNPEGAFKTQYGGGGGGGLNSGALAREAARTLAEEAGAPMPAFATAQPENYTSALKAHMAIEEGQLAGGDILRVAHSLKLIENQDDVTIKDARSLIAKKAAESFGVNAPEKVEAKKDNTKKAEDMPTPKKTETVRCHRCNAKVDKKDNYCTLCGARVMNRKALDQKVVEDGPEEKGDKVPEKKPEAPETLIESTKETETDPKAKMSDYKEVPTQKVAQLGDDVKEDLSDEAEAVADAVVPQEGEETPEIEEQGECPVKEKIEDAQEVVEDAKNELTNIGKDFAELLGKVDTDEVEDYGKRFVDTDEYDEALENGNNGYEAIDNFYDNLDVNPKEGFDIVLAKEKVKKYAKFKKGKRMGQMMTSIPTTGVNTPATPMAKQPTFGDKVMIPATKLNSKPNEVEEATVMQNQPADKTMKVQTEGGKVTDVDKDKVGAVSKTAGYQVDWLDMNDEENNPSREDSGYVVSQNGKPLLAIRLIDAFGKTEEGKRVASAETITNWEKFKSMEYQKKLEAVLKTDGIDGVLKCFPQSKDDIMIREGQEISQGEKETLPPTNSEIANIPQETEEAENAIVPDEVSDDLTEDKPVEDVEIMDTISDVLASFIATNDKFDIEAVIDEIRNISADETKLSEFKGKLEQKVNEKKAEVETGKDEETPETEMPIENDQTEMPETENELGEKKQAQRFELAKAIYNANTKFAKLQKVYEAEMNKNLELKKKLASADRQIKAYELKEVELVKKPKVKKVAQMCQAIGLEITENELMAMENDKFEAKQKEVSKIYAKFTETKKQEIDLSENVEEKRVAKQKGSMITMSLPKGEDSSVAKQGAVGFKFSSLHKK